LHRKFQLKTSPKNNLQPATSNPHHKSAMPRRLTFVPYRPKTILNKGKHPDHWFWSRYSAYPYIGCQHGCEFCYCREQKYSPYDSPDDFAYVVKVKENAPDLLYKALSRLPVDVVFTGDYQPAERKFGVARKMLEVCLDLGFPVFVLERSPLVLRDIELIKAIHAKARAVVAFSIISTPDSPGYTQVRRLERLAPALEKRFAAMEQFARAGIVTGAVMMPILPGFCDDDANLQAVVRWTAEHGGQFVLASGLTLSDQQKDFFFQVLRQHFSDMLPLYQRLYPQGSYAAANWNWPRVGLRIRELCQQHGISHRVPRPIIPGEKRALNKRVAEALANELYDMELQNAPSHRVWAYRKAAWAVEEMEQDLGLFYRTLGLKGLEGIPDVGPRLGPKIENLLKNWL
jgi:DNA repair photolyase